MQKYIHGIDDAYLLERCMPAENVNSHLQLWSASYWMLPRNVNQLAVQYQTRVLQDRDLDCIFSTLHLLLHVSCRIFLATYNNFQDFQVVSYGTGWNAKLTA